MCFEKAHPKVVFASLERPRPIRGLNLIHDAPVGFAVAKTQDAHIALMMPQIEGRWASSPRGNMMTPLRLT